MHAINFSLRLLSYSSFIPPTLHTCAPPLPFHPRAHQQHDDVSLTSPGFVLLTHSWWWSVLTRLKEKICFPPHLSGKQKLNGLLGLSYSETTQNICQGDPECPPPWLWLMHAGICLQTRRVLQMRITKSHSPVWNQAIAHRVEAFRDFGLAGPKHDCFPTHRR